MTWWRAGGEEEFILLMSEIDQVAAVQTAEHLRTLIEGMVLPDDVRITLSFNVAQWMPVEESRTWFKRADNALPRAKEQGRNRVEECLWCRTFPVGTTGLDWSPTYETGSEVVDGEPQELLEISSRLLAHIEDPEHLFRAKEELSSHIVKHFAHEEKLMKESGYPDRKHHAAVPKHLIERAVETFAEIDKGYYDTFHFFLIDEIVIEHFFDEDKPFAEYMQQQSAAS